MNDAADKALSTAQIVVLATVDRRGASAIGARTDPSHNVVHAGAARALIRMGILEEFLGPDGGPFVRMSRKLQTKIAMGDEDKPYAEVRLDQIRVTVYESLVEPGRIIVDVDHEDDEQLRIVVNDATVYES